MPGFIGPSHGSKPITFILRPAQVTAIPKQILVDSAVIASKTVILDGEIEFIHPTGSWGPFDTDSGFI